MAVDYNVLGNDMQGIRDTIVATFKGAMAKDKRPRSIMIWGPPGCGKTMTVNAVGRKLSKDFGVTVPVYAQATSCLEPTDVAGVPTPVQVRENTRYTAYLPPKWGYFCSVDYEEDMQKEDPNFKAPPVILFFDDIVAAHFQTQTAFFKLVHEGHCGDSVLRNNVMVVAAGNRVEDNAGANDMPTALANRFHHLYAKPTPDDWVKWAQNEGKCHPFVVAYIRKNKGDLHEFNNEVANRAEKAFASPRSWEMVSDIMNEGIMCYDRENEDSSYFFRLIAGTIGSGIATKFSGFMRNTNAVVSPEVICKNPHKAAIPNPRDPAGLSALYATIASLEAHLIEHPKDWRPAMIYATRKDMLSDYGVMLAMTCMGVVTERLAAAEMAEAMGSDELTALYERYDGILDAVS